MIYGCLLIMLVVSAASLGYWTKQHVRHSLQDEITRNLQQKAQMLANRVNADRGRGLRLIASQEGQAAGARATIIDSNGQVIADSEAPVAAQENMGKLPEFAAALSGQTGTDVRSRNGIQVLFVAVPVSGGAVRLSYPLSDVDAAGKRLAPSTLVTCAVLALVGFVISAIVAKTASFPG
jgi:hypothetical protein